MALKNKLQLATFFISMLMLTACGGGGDDSAPRPATPAVTPPVTPAVTPAVTKTIRPLGPTSFDTALLDGSWRTACQASKALDGYDEQDIFNFKGNKRTTTKFFYLPNTNCKHSEEALRVREVAGIAFGEAVNKGTNTRHTKINITPTKVMLAPMNSTFEALLNNTGHTSMQSIYNGYGRTDWDRYYWKDLSNIEDARTNFKINEVVPDILQISDIMDDGTTHKVLKMGVQGGNLDSDGRPLSLATSITATFEQKTTTAQTTQVARLTGTWKYTCRIAKGNPKYYQNSTLTFTGNKLTTLINFYVGYANTDENRHLIDRHCKPDHSMGYQVEIEADIVVGKVINKGAANEHTEIGIKTTKVQIRAMERQFNRDFGSQSFYSKYTSKYTVNLYNGYGQTDWKLNDWKDISGVPDAIKKLNIGTQVPDIFKISTVTGGGKELKMGDYQGTFDINGRAMSLEAKGATLQ